MKKLVIDESKWYRGHGHELSRLLLDDGRMCCLGFLCLANGAAEKSIRGVGFPSQTPESERIDSIGCGHTRQRVIGEVNDDPAINDKTRKTKLRHLFAEFDYELEFMKGESP